MFSTDSPLNSMTTDDSNQMREVNEIPIPVAQRRQKIKYSGPGSTCPYRYVNTIVEDHKCCIYSVKFCPFIEDFDLFATVAGRQVTVYECRQQKTIPRATYFDDCVSFYIFFNIIYRGK